MAICRCSFCGRSQNDVSRLVASETSATAICVDCTLSVLDVFAADDEVAEPSFTITPLGREVAERIGGEARP